MARHGTTVAHLRPVYLGNDLFAYQPIVAEYLHGDELQEHRQTVCKRGERTTTIYRWLNATPLRATDDAILVNWFSIETFNAKRKRTYYNSFITDLAITPGTVAELAACGRASPAAVHPRCRGCE